MVLAYFLEVVSASQIRDGELNESPAVLLCFRDWNQS